MARMLQQQNVVILVGDALRGILVCMMASRPFQVAVLFYRASEWSYLKRVNVYYPAQSGVIKNGKHPVALYVTEFCLGITYRNKDDARLMQMMIRLSPFRLISGQLIPYIYNQ